MNELKTCPVCHGIRFYKKLLCTDHTTSNETFNIVSCETILKFSRDTEKSLQSINRFNLLLSQIGHFFNFIICLGILVIYLYQMVIPH